MREFSTAIVVAAASERVWAVLADLERWSDWTPSVRRVERLDAGPLIVGSRVRVEQPRLRPTVWTITEWTPTIGFTWVSTNPGFVVTGRHSLESLPDGTQVTLSIGFSGPLAQLIGFVAGGTTRKYIELEAAGLKARCEVMR